MSTLINLVDETVGHFQEGARSVRAYTDETTYIITKDRSGDFIVTTEEPGFAKRRTKSLEEYFENVFGIEARY